MPVSLIPVSGDLTPPEIFLTLFPFLPFILVFPVARLLPEPHKYMIFNG
jgi:hypothetical protein